MNDLIKDLYPDSNEFRQEVQMKYCFTKSMRDIVSNDPESYKYYKVDDVPLSEASNEAIRDLMLKLSLRSYSFAEIKERSAFKSELAETLRKEAYAKNFNSAEGTVAVRENTAVLNSSSEILANQIYELVADIFKSKLDETHRIVAALTSVLMSRMSEAKLTTVNAEVI